MDDFFGGSLLIKDAFSDTFSRFTSGITKTSNGFRMFSNQIGQSERANRLATQNMKSQITQLAQTYVQQGYTMQQALKRATKEISREAPTASNAWINAFGRIKQIGVDSFSSIHGKIQSFSNSTLGMITKITAGFISMKTVMSGIKTGFTTGMQYEDSRITMDALYGNKTIGGQQFKMASNFANETPWTQEETIKSLVKLKSYGLDDDKSMLTMMSDLGATFKSSGKNMNDATEAYADMMNGEWERMTEFGIKRTVMESKGKEMGLTFDNKKGQITNKENLAIIFKQYMDDKNYTGMTKELSNTASGKLNTMTDNIKKSLANLVGIAEDGSVKDGSLFDRFIKGMDVFTKKIDSFVASDNFDKISNALADIGGAISSSFEYLMDHPEVASGLIKLGIGLIALNVVSSVISPVTSLASAFATFAPILAPIAPYLIAFIGALTIFKSIISSDGMLHNGISWLLSKIPLIGAKLQEGFENGSALTRDFFGDIWGKIKSQFGFETNNDAKFYGDNEKDKWFTGKYEKVTDKDLKYTTASDLVKNGAITKTDNSKTVTNKTEVNLNVDTIKETADIDEFMDTVLKRIDKYSQTRNNLE